MNGGNQMKAIGIDIGTTKICGILFNSNSKTIEKVISHTNNTWISSAHSWEKIQNPDEIYNITFKILKELYTDEVCSIGITGQMHGILYTDIQLNAVSPLYTWQDERGNLPFKGTTYAKYLDSYSGYGNVTHFYNEQNRLIPKSAALYCTITDYICAKITGASKPIMHISNACSLGLFDINSTVFTSQNSFQPKVAITAQILGKWNNTPVSISLGDNQASFIGCGCSENSVLLNIGTGGQVSMLSNIAAPPQGTEIRPLYDDKKIIVGSSLCGGRAYALLEKFFRQVFTMSENSQEDIYEWMLEESKKAPSTDMFFSTLFCGTREHPHIHASINNLTEDNFNPASLIRACMNGIVAELYDLYSLTGKNYTRLIASGNGIRKNPELRKTAEKFFNKRALIPKHREEAAVGAALFSLAALNQYDPLDYAKRSIEYENL